MYACVCVSTCVHVCACARVCICVRMRVSVSVCVHVCVRVCDCVCMCVFTCARTRVVWKAWAFFRPHVMCPAGHPVSAGPRLVTGNALSPEARFLSGQGLPVPESRGDIP